MNRRRARAYTSGSCSATQAIFGPADCEVSTAPQCATISSWPSTWVSRRICSSARVSTP